MAFNLSLGGSRGTETKPEPTCRGRSRRTGRSGAPPSIPLRGFAMTMVLPSASVMAPPSSEPPLNAMGSTVGIFPTAPSEAPADPRRRPRRRPRAAGGVAHILFDLPLAGLLVGSGLRRPRPHGLVREVRQSRLGQRRRYRSVTVPLPSGFGKIRPGPGAVRGRRKASASRPLFGRPDHHRSRGGLN